MSWRQRGACWDTDSTIFFPIRAELGNKEYEKAVERAQAICEGCPVREPCRKELEDNEYGIWGGIDARA